jgi:conjugal transfer mating pair stabilization protein TraG
MWEIFAYHNSDALFGIFNAVAAIMGSGTYLSAIAAVAFCGFVAAMVAYMFAPEKLQGWKWLGTVVLVYGVLFVPRVTIGIVDKTGGTPVKVVANVPFGMAALGGLTSTIGNSITELFETAFQTIPGPGSLPSELSYQQNGLMFGSRLIQETRRASLPDPAVRTDLLNFVNNCTAYDIADGTISPTAFSTSDDLWTTMSATNPARFSIITSASGVTTNTCDQVYASIDARLPAQVTDLTNRLGLRLNPSLSAMAAQAAVVNQIPQAYIRNQIAVASATAADLVRQNALINAINDAGEMGCQRVNDPSCMMLATGRASAVASQNAAWINGAKISEQALPVVRNVAEALCYAVFPLIVLLLFLSSGKNTLLMLTGYVTALVSIQLWPPLFAILNYMASIYSQLDQAAAAEIGGGAKGLALQSASPIYSNAVSAQAVVSYLVIGIPMLAYALSNRLMNFGSTLVGGLTGLQSTIGNASAAAAVGNSSMGNVTMDQRNVSPSTSSPWVSREQDASGNWTTTNGTGQQAVEYLRNIGAVSNRISARVSQEEVSEASKAAEAARGEVVSASTERSAALVDAVSKASGASVSTRSSSGQGMSSYEELGKSADRIAQLSKQVAATTGMNAAQVQQIAFQLSAGIGTPGMSPVKANMNASGGKSYASSLTEAEQRVQTALGAEGLREFKSFGDRATRDTSFLRAISSETRDGSELASRLSSSTSRVESAQAAYARRQAVAERLSTARSTGQEISVDLAQLPINSDFMRRYNQLASEYGPNSQALRVAMASELASYAVSPNRHFSDGTAMPSSFTDVEAAHRKSASNDAFLAGRVDNTDRLNERAVGPVGRRTPQQVTTPSELQGVRSQVDAQQGLAKDAADKFDTYDTRNEVTRNQDGTVSTKGSQLKANVRQLRDDVTNMGENAKELWNDSKERAAEEANARAARIATSNRVKAIESTPEVPTMGPNSGKRKKP